jgi:hypothetical protein
MEAAEEEEKQRIFDYRSVFNFFNFMALPDFHSQMVQT